MATRPPMLTQVYSPTRSAGWASSMSRQYQAVWLICSKQLRMAASRNSQKLWDTDHTRQARAQPKKSPIMVVNFRPSLSARMPAKKEKNTWMTMVMDRMVPICTSVTPWVYIYRVAKGAMRL